MSEIVIPLPELIFYFLVAAWCSWRYHWLARRKDEPEDDDNPQEVPRIFKNYDKLLEEKSRYYRQLNIGGRLRFIERLRAIRDSIEIQGREDFEVNPEHEVLVCASITQLTFGYDQPEIPGLQGVVLFPGIFYSKLLDNHVKGMAMGNGVVFMSWSDFEMGYADDTDTYNLGLHEMAHILRLQALNGGMEDNRLSLFYNEWIETANEIFNDIRHGNQNFFREYGGTNEAEFFSVCIENFFEVPESFEEKHPELYYHLCYLLRQNPLNAKEAYAFDRDDALEANQEIESQLPVYEVYSSIFDQRLFSGLGRIWALYLLLILSTANFLDNHYPYVEWMRIWVVSLFIGLGIRAHAFKSLKAIGDREYFKHFMLKIAPITLLITCYYVYIWLA